MTERFAEKSFNDKLNSFITTYGSRLSEALFRIGDDPQDSETHAIAEEERVCLRELASLGGISGGELQEIEEFARQQMLVNADGELFIDTPEGAKLYLDKSPSPIVIW